MSETYYVHDFSVIFVVDNLKGNMMRANTLTPTQQHLLKIFSFNDSEAYAREVQEVLTRHFQEKLDREADKLWDQGILDQKRLDELRTEDLHRKD